MIKKLILFISLAAISLSFSPARAEVKTFTEEYSYRAGSPDSKVSARALACEGVKDRLWKDLRDALEPLTPVRSLRLTARQSAAYVPVLAPVRIEDEKWNGRTYTVEAALSVELGAVSQSLQLLLTDDTRKKELEENRKKRQETLGKMTVLREQATSSTARERKKISGGYQALARELAVSDGLLQGYIAENAGKWAEAKKAFKKVLSLDRGHKTALYHRGAASFRLGRKAEAIHDFTSVLKLDPENIPAYYTRGILYAREGKNRKAIGDFSKLIEIDNQFGTAYYQRGLALDRTGNREEAIRDFTRAIELNPEYSEAYLNRGAAYAKMGYHREAGRDLAKAVKLDQKHELTSALPELPEKTENGFKTVKELDAAIAGNPNSAEAYYRRGMAHDNVGNHQLALQDFNKAIELNPRDAAAYFMRGLTYGMIDVSYDSIKDIKVSARLGYKPAQQYMNAVGVPW